VQAAPQQTDARLRQALAALSERRWTIVLITAAAVAGAAALLAVSERSYTATAEVLVRPTVTEAAGEEEVNLETEKRVAESHEVVSRAAPELGLDTSEASDALSVSNVAGTEILVLSFEAGEPEDARRGAEVFAEAYLDNRHEQAGAEVAASAESVAVQIESLRDDLAARNRDAQQADTQFERIAAETEADTLAGQIAALQSDLAALTEPSRVEIGRVVQPPELPSNPSGAGAVPTLVLALLLGLALGVAAALFKDRLDERLRDRIRVEAVTGAPVLAAIPPLPRKSRRRGAPPVTFAEPDGQAAEAYRILRARLAPILDNGRVRTILVTSPHATEGKSACAANLAVAFAQANKRTVLVAADLRRPTLHLSFNAQAEPGLSNLLSSDGERSFPRSLPTGIRNLAFLPSGPLPRNPAELLEGGAMSEVLHGLRENADVVIVDSPPLLAVADATALASMVDGVVLVADARTSTRADLADAARVLRQVNATIVGCVLNNFEASRAAVYAPEPAGSV
jgi:polysaccharide biosynthesis transport protein